MRNKPLFLSALQLGITDRDTIFDLMVDEEATRNMNTEQRTEYFRNLDSGKTSLSGIDHRPPTPDTGRTERSDMSE